MSSFWSIAGDIQSDSSGQVEVLQKDEAEK